jgi:hypothetical protein
MLGTFTLVTCFGHADDDISAVLNATSPGSFEKAFGSLVSKLRNVAIGELTGHENASLALRGAWHSMVVDSPGYGRAERLRDQQGAHRFLGFLEGRLRMSPPSWWRDVLLDARFDTDGNPRFSYDERWSLYGKSGSQFRVHAGISAVSSNGEVKVSDGAISLSIPGVALKELSQGGGNEQLDVLLKRETSILAAHSSSGFGFPVIALDTQTGRILWKVNAWGAGVTRGFGVSYHRVSMILHHNEVVVFGVDPRALYVEGYSVSGGDVLYRFCTGYPVNE